MPVQGSKQSDESQGPASVRPNESPRPGGHLRGDRTLSEPRPPPVYAVRTARGILGYVDPDGPAPIHPRGCAGDGACLWCVALQHWHHCQRLKAQRPAVPSSAPPASTAIERVPFGPRLRSEREPVPPRARRKRKPRALPPGGDS